MAENLQKYQFTSEQVQKIRMGVPWVDQMYAKIAPKFRNAKAGDALQVKRALWMMADYVFYNIGKKPPVPFAGVTHSKAMIARLNKAKQACNAVFDSIQPAKKAENGQKKAKILDLLNRFGDHVEYRIKFEK